jgi:hypothetical protein
MSTFSFNSRAFDKLMKDEVSKAIKGEIKKSQTMLDRLLRTYKGRPVPEVKTALLREWRRDGGKMTDAEATDWAKLISGGTRIALKQ